MAMEISIEKCSVINELMWKAEVSPSDIRRLGSPAHVGGVWNVLLLKEARYDPATTTLRFNPDAVTVLSVGNTHAAIMIAEGVPGASPSMAPSTSTQVETTPREPLLGSGDQVFLRQLAELPPETAQAGTDLLRAIRTHFPGSLRQISDRRFQETPDNFWFATIQPRDQSIVITVRGLPERYGKTQLNVVVDRPPYSRFKIRTVHDVGEAFEIIFKAIRKTM